MIIRIAGYKDLFEINDIYNQSIPSQISTAHISSVMLDERIAWYNEHDPENYPVYVAEINNIIVGWASLSAYRKGRMALRYTAELSYYIHQNYRHQGIGTELINYILKIAASHSIRNIFAIVLEPNEASIRLLVKAGFVEWGFLPLVADFDGNETGQFYYGKRLL